MSEKPLHVQVAEALGWRIHGVIGGGWWAFAPSGEGAFLVERYDTDWSATGPLIEKYGITIFRYEENESVMWQAFQPGSGVSCSECGSFQNNISGDGSTPLLAVCHLILALAKAGKL
jgi:hypothetical protein